jgi:DNA-binding XRE family transcriptional regulator
MTETQCAYLFGSINARDFRDMRVNFGFTREEMSESLGVSLKTIENYECLKKPIPRTVYLKMKKLKIKMEK